VEWALKVQIQEDGMEEEQGIIQLVLQPIDLGEAVELVISV
jgi:hypothetical protein